MKPNAAAPGTKYGNCQKVVHINSHGSQQDEPVPFPVLFVVPVSDQAYNKKVEGVMDEGLQ